MRCFRAVLAACVLLLLLSLQLSPVHGDDIADRARKLHFSSIVLDTHDDTTQRFFAKNYDLAKRNPDGHIDIPRMREGGMNAIFFSIWIDGRIMGPPAVQKALDQIDLVHENVRKNSKDMVFCRTAEEVRRAHAQGKIAALIGVEGGHMIGNDIRMVRIFGRLGVGYMTLSHFYTDEWADSSTDKPAHNGLTDYGSIVDAPFGSYLGLRSGSSIDIPSPSLYYYRWSYRRAGTTSSFTPLHDSVIKHYVKQSPTTLPSFPAYSLGPHTAGTETDLFQFKPVNPPGPAAGDPPGTITYWPTDDFLDDIYSGYWDTLSIPGNVMTAAGEYQVKLEVFDQSGNIVHPGAGTFTFIVPSGIGSDGVTILARAADASEIDAGGFVFNLHVDNNSCTASIDPASIGGSFANACGFLTYSNTSDPVTLSFHAKHPNNFATFNWDMVRGLSGLGTLDVTGAEVAATTAGPYTGDGAGDFSGTEPASSLLGACVNAAFAEHLHVVAKATNGWGQLSQYDAEALGAFALEES